MTGEAWWCHKMLVYGTHAQFLWYTHFRDLKTIKLDLIVARSIILHFIALLPSRSYMIVHHDCSSIAKNKLNIYYIKSIQRNMLIIFSRNAPDFLHPQYNGATHSKFSQTGTWNLFLARRHEGMGFEGHSSIGILIMIIIMIIMIKW